MSGTADHNNSSQTQSYYECVWDFFFAKSSEESGEPQVPERCRLLLAGRMQLTETCKRVFEERPRLRKPCGLPRLTAWTPSCEIKRSA